MFVHVLFLDCPGPCKPQFGQILGNTIRNDKEIRGIKVLCTECKLSQYADDDTTARILDGSESYFSRSLYLLDAFASISGLKVKYDKYVYIF